MSGENFDNIVCPEKAAELRARMSQQEWETVEDVAVEPEHLDDGNQFDWTKVPFSWERSPPAELGAAHQEAVYLAEIHTHALKDSLTQAALFAADGPNQNIPLAQRWIRMASISAGIVEDSLVGFIKAGLKDG